MSDEEIIGLYREGKKEKAFNGLVRSYGERLYWHLRSFVQSHEDADDLLQEVFLKIWNALPLFRGEARLYTWVYRIATNEALNTLRKTRLKHLLSLSSPEASYVAGLESDPYFNGDEAQKRLLAVVCRLPEKQRLVFVMRYFEDMDYKEIAEILRTSPGSVKVSYHHAYVKIKKELSEDF